MSVGVSSTSTKIKNLNAWTNFMMKARKQYGIGTTKHYPEWDFAVSLVENKGVTVSHSNLIINLLCPVQALPL